MLLNDALYVLILQESYTLDFLPASQLLTNCISPSCEYFFMTRVYTATVSASGLCQSRCPALIKTLFIFVFVVNWFYAVTSAWISVWRRGKQFQMAVVGIEKDTLPPRCVCITIEEKTILNIGKLTNQGVFFNLFFSTRVYDKGQVLECWELGNVILKTIYPHTPFLLLQKTLVENNKYLKKIFVSSS